MRNNDGSKPIKHLHTVSEIKDWYHRGHLENSANSPLQGMQQVPKPSLGVLRTGVLPALGSLPETREGTEKSKDDWCQFHMDRAPFKKTESENNNSKGSDE